MPLQSRLLEPGKSYRFVPRHTFTMKIKIGEIVLSLRFAGFRASPIPTGSRGVVLRDAQTMIIEITKVHLCGRVAVFGPQLKEVERFGQILPNPTALEIQNAQVVESRGKAAIGRSMQPI